VRHAVIVIALVAISLQLHPNSPDHDKLADASLIITHYSSIRTGSTFSIQYPAFTLDATATISSLLLIPIVLAFTMTLGASSFYHRLPLQIKLLSDKATLPKAGSDLAAGIDLCSAVNMVIPSQSRALVATDLSVACPPGTYARIAPRSGLALKHGIDVGAGVIDADYRGPVGVILFNWGDKEFEIKQGDRIAQMILEQIVVPQIMQVEELTETVRGEGGFGSTGVNEHVEKKIRTEGAVSPELDEEVKKI
jgi:dUTP pyrophosphatase